MKTKLLAGALILSTFTTGASLAYTENSVSSECGAEGQKVCMADEIMKELVKQTIYTVGSRVLDKVVGPNNGSTVINTTQNTTSSNTTTSTSTNTTASSSSTTDQSTTANSDVMDEELIPL